MSDALVDMRHIRFLLYEVLDTERLTRFPLYADHSRETLDMAIDTAYQLAQEVFWASYQDDDRHGAQFDGKNVTVPKGIHEAWTHCKEGGWMAPSAPYEYGGAQYPLTMHALLLYLFNAGNTAASMYVGGATGAARLLQRFGCDYLKNTYMTKLYAGEWAGTMALTEPDVGTSIGDITTIAAKASDGDYYHIKGVKRFISSGDHDLTENIVHPTLARIEGAPPGIKGLSLFIVPKYRIKDDGSLGEFNHVVTAGIEHKMGLKAQATATLNYGETGDCHGWLVGEPNQGLQYMFELMNEARVFTGIQAVAGASAAYQCALKYTKERIQGRDLANMKDPLAPQVAIINHADVRLMLLEQKAFIEGCLGLILYCADLADQYEVATDDAERERTRMVLEVLTPCCKAYGSYGAFDAIVKALQCLGGVGYTEDFPIAQILRDNKVFSIYEGANGIQALDLLGRKVAMKAGAAVRELMGEIGATLTEADNLPDLDDITAKVREVQNEVVATTMHLGMLGMSGQVDLFVCNASEYLRLFSQMAVSWQLLRQAVVAQKALNAGTAEEAFYRSKVEVARFYTNRTLPHALATVQIIKANERTALDFKPEWF